MQSGAWCFDVDPANAVLVLFLDDGLDAVPDNELSVAGWAHSHLLDAGAIQV